MPRSAPFSWDFETVSVELDRPCSDASELEAQFKQFYMRTLSFVRVQTLHRFLPMQGAIMFASEAFLCLQMEGMR